MNLKNFVIDILIDLWSHRTRTYISIFCIAWGTFTTTILLALGDGFRVESEKNIFRLTENAFLVVPGITSKNYQGYPKGRSIKIQAPDVDVLPQKIHQILYVSPVLLNNYEVSFEGVKASAGILGVGENLNKVRKIDLRGNSRFFNHLDIAQAKYVAILGSQIKKSLFGGEEAIGKNISIRGINLKVIGELAPLSGLTLPSSYARRILIPYSTFTRIFGEKIIDFFMLLPDPSYSSESTEKSIRSYFGFLFHFADDDLQSLKIFDTATMYKFFNWFFLGIKLFLALCGGIILGVGSIGIANIMFFTIAERTHEIGIRMAIGAKDNQLLTQVLFSGLFVVAVGGILGFFLSYSVIYILRYVPLPDWLGRPTFSLSSILISVAILGVFGLLAGYFPARKAASMDPVEALNTK